MVYFSSAFGKLPQKPFRGRTWQWDSMHSLPTLNPRQQAIRNHRANRQNSKLFSAQLNAFNSQNLLAAAWARELKQHSSTQITKWITDTFGPWWNPDREHQKVQRYGKYKQGGQIHDADDNVLPATSPEQKGLNSRHTSPAQQLFANPRFRITKRAADQPENYWAATIFARDHQLCQKDEKNCRVPGQPWPTSSTQSSVWLWVYKHGRRLGQLPRYLISYTYWRNQIECELCATHQHYPCYGYDFERPKTHVCYQCLFRSSSVESDHGSSGNMAHLCVTRRALYYIQKLGPSPVLLSMQELGQYLGM